MRAGLYRWMSIFDNFCFNFEWKKNPKIQSILKFNIAQRSRGKCDQNGFHSMPYHWLGSIEWWIFQMVDSIYVMFPSSKKIYNYIKVWCAVLCCTAWFPKVTMFDWHVGDRISGFNFKRFVESRRLFVFLLPQPRNAILIRTNWLGIYQEKWNRSSMYHHFSSWCFRLVLPKKMTINFLLSFDNIIYLFSSHSRTHIPITLFLVLIINSERKKRLMTLNRRKKIK